MNPGVFAHTLKNAIQPLRYHLDLLCEASCSNEEIRGPATKAEKQLSFLELLISRVETLTRPVEIQRREHNVLMIVESAWSEASARLDATPRMKRTLQIDRGAIILADDYWFKAALVEILVNAIEACSNPNAEISLSFETGKKRASLTVQDTGCGVDRLIRNELIAPFVSIHNLAGRGLGLPLADHILRAHGGELTWRSSETGSIFKLSLPAGEL